jgi:hypothetical protein
MSVPSLRPLERRPPLGHHVSRSRWPALVACWSGPAMLRRWRLIATFSAIGVMVAYPIFFAERMSAFVRGGLSDSAVRSLLDRWAA